LSASFGTNWMKPFPSRLVPWIASMLTWASPRSMPRRASVPGVSCTVTLNSTAIRSAPLSSLEPDSPGSHSGAWLGYRCQAPRTHTPGILTVRRARSRQRQVTVAAVARVVSVGAVAADVSASGAAVLARSCDAASLQDFDAIHGFSLNYSICLAWQRRYLVCHRARHVL
jgi:hypothetical protein